MAAADAESVPPAYTFFFDSSGTHVVTLGTGPVATSEMRSVATVSKVQVESEPGSCDWSGPTRVRSVLRRDAVLKAKAKAMGGLVECGWVAKGSEQTLSGKLADGVGVGEDGRPAVGDPETQAALNALVGSELALAGVARADALFWLAGVVAGAEAGAGLVLDTKVVFTIGGGVPGPVDAGRDALRMWIPLGNLSPHQGAAMVPLDGGLWASESYDMGDVLVLPPGAEVVVPANTTGSVGIGMMVTAWGRDQAEQSGVATIDQDTAQSLVAELEAARAAAARANLDSDSDSDMAGASGLGPLQRRSGGGGGGWDTTSSDDDADEPGRRRVGAEALSSARVLF